MPPPMLTHYLPRMYLQRAKSNYTSDDYFQVALALTPNFPRLRYHLAVEKRR